MKVLSYFLVLLMNDGSEHVVDGPMPIEDCIYSMLDHAEANEGLPSYSCELVVERK